MDKRARYSGTSRRPQARPIGRPPVRRSPSTPRGTGAKQPLPPNQNRKPAPRKKRRLKRHLTLLILEAIGGVFSGLKNAYASMRKTTRFRELSLIAALILVIIGGIWMIGHTTRPNAFMVEVNGQNLGTVRWQGYDMEPEYFETHTRYRLQSQFETDVFLNATITATPTRAGSNAETVTFSTMITSIIDTLDFYINAAKIAVDGSPIVILANEAQADALINDIKYNLSFGNPNEYHFEQIVDTITQRVHKDEVHTKAQALDILTTPRYLREVHTVGQGEMLYTIAQTYGMTLSGLLALNPNINPDDILREGTTLLVTPNTSILTVRRIHAEQQNAPYE